MSYVLIYLGMLGVFFWFIKSYDANNSTVAAESSPFSGPLISDDGTGSSLSEDGAGTSMFDGGTGIESTCCWCGSSLCSGGYGCTSISNPLGMFYDDHMSSTCSCGSNCIGICTGSSSLFCGCSGICTCMGASSMFDDSSSICSHSMFDD